MNTHFNTKLSNNILLLVILSLPFTAFCPRSRAGSGDVGGASESKTCEYLDMADCAPVEEPHEPCVVFSQTPAQFAASLLQDTLGLEEPSKETLKQALLNNLKYLNYLKWHTISESKVGPGKLFGELEDYPRHHLISPPFIEVLEKIANAKTIPDLSSAIPKLDAATLSQYCDMLTWYETELRDKILTSDVFYGTKTSRKFSTQCCNASLSVQELDEEQRAAAPSELTMYIFEAISLTSEALQALAQVALLETTPEERATNEPQEAFIKLITAVCEFEQGYLKKAARVPLTAQILLKFRARVSPRCSNHLGLGPLYIDKASAATNSLLQVKKLSSKTAISICHEIAETITSERSRRKTLSEQFHLNNSSPLKLVPQGLLNLAQKFLSSSTLPSQEDINLLTSTLNYITTEHWPYLIRELSPDVCFRALASAEDRTLQIDPEIIGLIKRSIPADETVPLLTRAFFLHISKTCALSMALTKFIKQTEEFNATVPLKNALEQLQCAANTYYSCLWWNSSADVPLRVRTELIQSVTAHLQPCLPPAEGAPTSISTFFADGGRLPEFIADPSLTAASGTSRVSKAMPSVKRPRPSSLPEPYAPFDSERKVREVLQASYSRFKADQNALKRLTLKIKEHTIELYQVMRYIKGKIEIKEYAKKLLPPALLDLLADTAFEGIEKITAEDLNDCEMETLEHFCKLKAFLPMDSFYGFDRAEIFTFKDSLPDVFHQLLPDAHKAACPKMVPFPVLMAIHCSYKILTLICLQKWLTDLDNLEFERILVRTQVRFLDFKADFVTTHESNGKDGGYIRQFSQDVGRNLEHLPRNYFKAESILNKFVKD